MYIPAAFAETDLVRLHDFIEQHSFGLLITTIADTPFATHLPFLLDRQAGPHGTLYGHVARANPQWHGATGHSALAVFSGPHAYISPAWYGEADVVPTWNYVAVHATGRLRIVDDPERLLELVGGLVQVYERARPHPWTLGDRTRFLDRMLAQIVGFELEIEVIEGKWKLNQNHSPERRTRVVGALRKIGGENALAIADLMAADLTAE